MIAHRAGRLTEAEVGYCRVLRSRPNEPSALRFLALLHFHRGEADSALQYLSRSLEHEPRNPRAWNDLGGMFISLSRADDALAAYRKAVVADPSFAEGWYNIGICLRDTGDLEGALDNLREAIARQADYFRAYEALAMLLYQLGRMREAAETYLEWSVRDPANSKARHMAAAASGQNVPSRASEDYVRDLFDSAAGKFDLNVEQLSYRAPELVAAALASHASERPLLAVLDAGCGTGLCGPLIRARCETLVGIDLSQKMIDQARARGCYDELIPAELTAFMQAHPNSFDAVVCADTLVYFGSLDEALNAARTTLRPSGLLIVTLEALIASRNEDDRDAGIESGVGENNDGSTSADHRLQFHGRYAHSEAYIRRVFGDTGFEVELLIREPLRKEALQDVAGYLVTARRR